MNPLWPERIGDRLARRHKHPNGSDILWLNPPLRDAADAEAFGITVETPLRLVVLNDYLPGMGPGYDPDDYSVLAGEVVVGRIKSKAPVGSGWSWSQSCAMRGDQSGSGETLDEAKAVFADRFRGWLAGAISQEPERRRRGPDALPRWRVRR